MSKTAQDIIDTAAADLRIDSLLDELTAEDCKRLIDGLEDGAALEALGFTDADEDAIEEAHAMLKDRSIKAVLEAAPGYASEVWGGWVWMIGSDEMSWSKRATREQCERAVVQAIGLHGLDGAFTP